MSRLEYVPKDMTFEYMEHLSYKDAVNLCSVNRNFKRLCNTPEGRERMRTKEAREAFRAYILFLFEPYNDARGGGHDDSIHLFWNGSSEEKEIDKDLSKEDIDEILSESGLTKREFDRLTPMAEERNPREWRESVIDLIMRGDARWILRMVGNGAGVDDDLVLKMDDIGEAVTGWDPKDKMGPLELFQLVKVVEFYEEDDSMYVINIEYNWERWNRYWKRGTSQRSYVFKHMWQ